MQPRRSQQQSTVWTRSINRRRLWVWADVPGGALVLALETPLSAVAQPLRPAAAVGPLLQGAADKSTCRRRPSPPDEQHHYASDARRGLQPPAGAAGKKRRRWQHCIRPCHCHGIAPRTVRGTDLTARFAPPRRQWDDAARGRRKRVSVDASLPGSFCRGRLFEVEASDSGGDGASEAETLATTV